VKKILIIRNNYCY